MVRNIQVQDTFSGPLDLLLYLVRRDEIDIHDIPVGHVTKEYLVELNKMQVVDVDAGGEFLAMASMLTEIKGRMLLPDVSEDEDEEDELYDPRQGLVEALLEYKKFKEVAAELEVMSDEFDVRYGRNVAVPEFQAVVKEKAEDLGALDLLAAFQRIARKMLNERAPREIVSEEVPTEVRIEQIEEVVKLRGRASFTSILSDSPSEDEMVGFFIAMLELIRMRKISAQQSIDFSEIYFIALDEEDEQEVVAQKDNAIIQEECAARNTVTYKRIVGLGMSNAFGVSRRVVSRANNLKSVTANRYDIFRSKSDSIVSCRKSNSGGMAFPSLLHNYMKVGVAGELDASSAGVQNEILEHNTTEIVKPVFEKKDISRACKKYNVGTKLSNALAVLPANKGCALGITCDNRFDMLGLRKPEALNHKLNRESVSGLEFMRIGVGRVCKHSSLKACPSKDNKIECVFVESPVNSLPLKYCMILANPFALTLGGQSHKVGVTVPNKFDVLGLRSTAYEKVETKLQINTQRFMPLGVGRVDRHVSTMIANAEEPAENNIVVNPIGKIKPSLLCLALANPFVLAFGCKCNKTTTALQNKFDVLRLKLNSDKSTTMKPLASTLGFMRISVGRVSKHSIKIDKVVAVDFITKDIAGTVIISNNEMKLADPFALSFRCVLGDKKVKAANKFDMLGIGKSIDIAHIDSSVKKSRKFLPLGVGRICQHTATVVTKSVAEQVAVIIDKASTAKQCTVKQDGVRSEFKLCDTFKVEKSITKDTQLNSSTNFDFIARKQQQPLTIIKKKSFL